MTMGNASAWSRDADDFLRASCGMWGKARIIEVMKDKAHDLGVDDTFEEDSLGVSVDADSVILKARRRGKWYAGVGGFDRNSQSDSRYAASRAISELRRAMFTGAGRI